MAFKLARQAAERGEVIEIHLPPGITLNDIPGSSVWIELAHRVVSGRKVLKDRDA
jgi:hypothetical protein